jgi:hypothetical protein
MKTNFVRFFAEGDNPPGVFDGTSAPTTGLS